MQRDGHLSLAAIPSQIYVKCLTLKKTSVVERLVSHEIHLQRVLSAIYLIVVLGFEAFPIAESPSNTL